MPSLSCLPWPRKRPASSEKPRVLTSQSSQGTKEPEAQKEASAYTAEQTARDDIILPDHSVISSLKLQVNTVLSQLTSLVAEDIDTSDETSVSISMHFADLQSSVNALSKLLKCDITKQHQLTDTRAARDYPTPEPSPTETQVERSRRLPSLPTPDFRDSLLEWSAMSAGHLEEQSSRNQRYSSSSSISSPPENIEPLKLSTRDSSPSSIRSIIRESSREASQPRSQPQNRRACSSPALQSSRVDLTRRHTTNPARSALRHGRTSELRPGLDGLFDAPLPSPPSSIHTVDTGESDSYRLHHFSTEEKTRRFRSMRMSLPPLGGLQLDHTAGAGDSGDDAGSEPLRMEELMSFLREGNSLRQL